METRRDRPDRSGVVVGLVLLLLVSSAAVAVAGSGGPTLAASAASSTSSPLPTRTAEAAPALGELAAPWAAIPRAPAPSSGARAVPAGVAPQGGSFLPPVSVAVGATPWLTLYDPADGDDYVLNSGSANVTILNNTSYVATVDLGYAPESAVFDDSNRCVYVAGLDSWNVSVICGTSIFTTIDVGGWVSALAYDPPTYAVYVVDYEFDNVTSWYGDEFLASTHVGTEPFGAAYDPFNGHVYVTNYGSSNVSILNGSVVAGTVRTGAGPLTPYPDPGNGYVYVPCYNSSNISVVDSLTHAVTLTVGSLPYYATYDPATEEMYFSNVASGYLSVLDGLEVVGSVYVGVTPYGATYDPTNGYVYVAGGGDDEVAVVNGTTVLGTIPAGTTAFNATYDPGNGFVYVTNLASNNVTVLNAAQHSVTVPPSGDNLPTHATWSLVVGGHTTVGTKGSSASLSVPNGTYEYFVRGPKGYVVSDLAPVGNLTVSGTTVTANGEPVSAAVFTPGQTTGTIFSRSGLPKGTPTCVVFEGEKVCVTKGTVSITNLTPATYQYSVAPLPGYSETVKVDGVAAPTSGWLTLTEKHATISVKYTPVTYALGFSETGLASGKAWTVKIKGELSGHPFAESRSSKTASISFSVPNGSFSYTVEHVKGYAWAGNGTVTVDGGPVSVPVTFAPAPAALSDRMVPVPPAAPGFDSPTLPAREPARAAPG